jgi:rfaE bifunctional protein kinase chain/domain
VTPRLPPLPPDRARVIIGAFPGVSVLVVGDVMIDQFIVGRVTRISPEAPVPIVRYERDETRIGGAANVANNLVALGAHADVVGLVGDDAEAEVLRQALTAQRVGAGGLVVDAGRRTTRKVRVVTDRHQQVARIDYERDDEARAEVESRLVSEVRGRAAHADAIVI